MSWQYQRGSKLDCLLLHDSECFLGSKGSACICRPPSSSQIHSFLNHTALAVSLPTAMTPRAHGKKKNVLSHLIEVPAVYDGTDGLWREMTRSTHLHSGLSVISSYPAEDLGCNSNRGECGRCLSGKHKEQ